MHKDLARYTNPITYYCTENNCDGILRATRTLQEHIFIETET